MDYLLSIIIPTRNREEYAFLSAIQILKSTSDSVQLVIQDNSDCDSLKEKLMNIPHFNRIKYNHTSDILSFVDNFSKGVELSDGEFLCMIGDDDGINPELEDLVRWAKENQIEAISPRIKLNYTWPNTGMKYYEKDTGNLMIIDFDMKSEFFSTRKELRRLLNSGAQNYLKYNLVKIYHGIVTKKLMDEVKATTGKYFGGLSPDIYAAVALSLVCDKVLIINYPLTIPGVCSKSGSGHSSTGRHHGKLEDAPHLIGHTNYQWSQFVPAFYSVETIWADTTLAAFREMNEYDLIENFSVPVLSAYCYKYKEFRNLIKENNSRYFIKKNKIKTTQYIIQLLSFIKGPLSDLTNRIKNRIFRRKGTVKIYNDVNNIIEAEILMEEYLEKKSKNINKVINRLGVK
ncbi:MAG: glycosyltransferase [Chitinophagaceae bacterium]|nr:MAG: glycosyltransferase [Chitinophagaceae bacterium]